eukprot:PhF_6_TR8437/c0_g1_i1/m.13148
MSALDQILSKIKSSASSSASATTFSNNNNSNVNPNAGGQGGQQQQQPSGSSTTSQQQDMTAAPQPTSAVVVDVGVNIQLVKSIPQDPLGLHVDDNLVVIHVAPMSVAAKANTPLRHRIVLVDGRLVTTKQQLAQVLEAIPSTKMELSMKLVPMSMRNALDVEALDTLIDMQYMEVPLNFDELKANPKYEFLNPESIYHNDYLSRLEEAMKVKKIIANAAAFATSVSADVVDKDFEEALRYLASKEPNNNGNNGNAANSGGMDGGVMGGGGAYDGDVPMMTSPWAPPMANVGGVGV